MSEQPLIAGRYELGTLIGRGGMGDVYRGHDTTTGEDVAIKLLHQNIVQDNPDIVDRFEREGEALRQLDHPSIVKILDTIEEDERHYLIMEYVSGGSLRDLIDDQGRLPIDAVLNVALDLADALTRAHRMNIIHRDIKPDNVLLAEDGTPRLTDFGVAHLGDRTRLTQTGSVIGTYAYLSPEACNGEELDERTDIWSFGIMLFEMLTGRLPFQETGTAAILTAILTKPAPDIRRLRPGVPEPLVRLIQQMLEKDRTRRISSVRLVGAEIEAIIRGMDTPLRNFMAQNASRVPEGSRFETPPNTGSDVPAMADGGDQTHGFSVYPSRDAVPSAYYPSSQSPAVHHTPGGTPITAEMLQEVTQASKWRWIAIMVIVTAMLCSLVLVIAILSEGTGGSDEGDTDLAGDGVAESDPTNDEPLSVEPVAEDELMVLVAELEPLGPEPRDVTRFIVADLERRFRDEAPFSNVAVRQYPAILRTDDEARAAAEANDATVVIWGNYTPNLIELDVQFGTVRGFPHSAMSDEVLARSANVRVRMADERRESVAQQVLGVLASLQVADGDVYEFMRTLATMAEIDAEDAEIIGSTVAAALHRYYAAFDEVPGEEIVFADQALDKDDANPLAYAMRAFSLMRSGQFAEAARVAETASRVGPDEWVTPLYIYANSIDDPARIADIYDQIAALRPDDWYAHAARGAANYLLLEYDLARPALERSIELDPPTNFPYAIAALIAMAEGRFEDAAGYMTVILDEYPEPDLYSRIVGAAVGGLDALGPVVSTFVNMTLGRYEEAITSSEVGLERLGPNIDLYTMQGLAHCSLGEPVQAEAAYTQALDLDDAAPFIVLMRADVRLKQGDTDGAEADLAQVAQSGLFPPEVVDAARAGLVTCDSFFVGIESGQIGPDGDASAAGATPLPAAPEAAVAPVAEGEYMVLVAEIERMGNDALQDAARLVADNLTDLLETELPFSNIRVRRYPAVITSDEDAQTVAAATGAVVVVWGNATGDLVELEIQAGALDNFPLTPFERALIEKTANVRVQVQGLPLPSLAPQVLSVISTLALAEGNAYENMRTLAIREALDVAGPDVVGNSVAAHVFRYYEALLDDPAQALEHIDAAISLDAGNPLLYALRAAANQRRGTDYWPDSQRDIDSAARLAPDDWAMPAILRAYITRDDTVIDRLTQTIELRANDWFGYFFRGVVYYDMGQPSAARADLDTAIALDPTISFPYTYRALLSLREGRLSAITPDIQRQIELVSDPAYLERLLHSAFGGADTAPYSHIIEGAVNLALGRYENAVATTRAGIRKYPVFADLHVLRGVAVNSSVT